MNEDCVIGAPAPPASEPVAGPPVFAHNGARMRQADPAKIIAYNFRMPALVGQADLQQLTLIHEKFPQHLSARLSNFLRMECAFRVTNFGSTTYGKFAQSVASPSHVTLFQVEPLHGVGVMEISIRLALMMADRMLGGKAVPPANDRNLTEIELALVEDILPLILSEWARLWEGKDQPLQPRCIGHETNGRFLQTSPPDTVMVVVGMEVALGEAVEPVQFALPFAMIEPLFRKIQGERRQSEEARPRQIRWRAPYDTIHVQVTAEWAVREITIRELLGLQTGNVLEMPRELLDQTRIRFADESEFIGTVGVKSGRVAVQLTKQNPRLC
jgi:flagellar motor switch protein FliM